MEDDEATTTTTTTTTTCPCASLTISYEPATPKLASNGGSWKMDVGSSADRGVAYEDMEDRHSIHSVKGFNVEDDNVLLGLYDGHGGFRFADLAALHLPRMIRTQLLRNGGLVRKAILDSFQNFDAVTRAAHFAEVYHYAERSDVGTTATIAYLQGDHVWIANVGDSRAVFFCGIENSDLQRVASSLDDDALLQRIHQAVDHSTTNPCEQIRVKLRGGQVRYDENHVLRATTRMDDVSLNMTRSLGDFDSKPYADGRVSGGGVDNVADTYHWMVKDKNPFVILASDGVWDAFSTVDAVRLVLWLRAFGKNSNEIANILVQKALERGSRDNVTAIVACW
jgi:protein phosphatase 2C family protein 2/3